jgi:hypothetical protein
MGRRLSVSLKLRERSGQGDGGAIAARVVDW